MENPSALSSEDHPTDWHRQLYLAIAILIAFSPMLLGDSVIWDDCLLDNACEEGDFASMRRFFDLYGGVWTAYLHFGLGSLPGKLFIYRSITILVSIGAAFCIFRLLWESESFDSYGAASVAFISAIYPFYGMWDRMIMLPYSIAYFCFFYAAYRCYRSTLEPTSWRSHLPTIMLFLLSFLINSFLVYFYCFFAFVALQTKCYSKWSTFYAFCSHHMVYLVMPLLFFFGKRLLYPPRGAVADYNQIRFGFPIVEKVLRAVKEVSLDQVTDLLRWVANSPAFFLSTLPLALLIVFLFSRAVVGMNLTRPSRRAGIASLGFAFFVLVAGLFPYCVVWKTPVINSYNSRHGLLAALPLAIVCVCALRLLIASDRIYRGATLLALLFIAAGTIRNQVLWQNRFIKYQGIIETLAEISPALHGLVLVDDQSQLGMKETLRHYEINWMLKHAFHNEKCIGFPLATFSRESLEDKSNSVFAKVKMFSEAEIGEDATEVVVSSSNDLSEPAVFLMYCFSSYPERRAFAKSLVKIETKAVPISNLLESRMSQYAIN